MRPRTVGIQVANTLVSVKGIHSYKKLKQLRKKAAKRLKFPLPLFALTSPECVDGHSLLAVVLA